MLGKSYIITGGTSGLGRAITAELVIRGCFVTVLARSEVKLNALINEFDGRVNGFVLDMADRDAVAAIDKQLTGRQFDGLINNAGFGYFKSFDLHSEEDIEQILSVNLTHTALLMKKVIPLLQQGAIIVNISSQAARVTTPYGAVYASSKAGLSSLANALRLEYPQFHFLTVQTGPIATNFFERADDSGRYDQLTNKMQLKSDSLAEDIVDAMIKRRVELNRPAWMHYSLSFYQLMPRMLEHCFQKAFLSKQQK